MDKINKIISNLDRFNVYDELGIILETLNQTIIGFNQGQLRVGLDADGARLEPYADPFYAIYKKDELKSDAPLGIPDLKLTGDFYKGFKIIIKEKEFEITSTDIKTLELEGKYGDIFGMTGENQAELAIKYILPLLQKRIKELLLIN